MFLIDRHSALKDGERRDQSHLPSPAQKSRGLDTVCHVAAVLNFCFCKQERMLANKFLRLK